jgi:hypothetical protein
LRQLHSTLISVTANPTRDTYPSAVDERLYSTYIVARRSRALDIGVTGDLRKRVFQHKGKEYEGFSANTTAIDWSGSRIVRML